MMTTPEGCNTGVESMWSGYIMVDDVDQYAKRVKDAGGKITVEPQDIPECRQVCVAADPQGAPFTLFKPSMQERGDNPKPPAPGTIGWHELNTSNWKSAFEFYSGLFGWTKGEAMDMGAWAHTRSSSATAKCLARMMNRSGAVSPSSLALLYLRGRY